MVRMGSSNLKANAMEAVASAPPLTVAGFTFLGHPLADWLQVLAAVWIIIQMCHFIYSKFIRKDKDA